MEGCQGRATIQINLRIHYVHGHSHDTAVILDEGNRPHPRCTFCNMFVPQAALNGRHPGTEMCARGAEQKGRRLAVEASRDGAETVFWAYGQPLANAGPFKYLVRLLSTTDSDCPAAMANLRIARKKWARIPQVLGW